jgi:hypothetical protein
MWRAAKEFPLVEIDLGPLDAEDIAFLDREFPA